MAEELLTIYDRGRDFSQKAFQSACYAPHTSLYFDQLGFVRACCQNFQHALGNVSVESLDDIWTGHRTRLLRKALENYDFSLGCQYCQWHKDEENATNFARQFDRWPVLSADEFWPQQMEFSISNTCNLECVMCNGEWSSSIRSRRENLPPLPKAYGDNFFSDLRKFLPHLRWIKMLGGEPFLARESFRIWDMIIEDGLTNIECHVTTNGTQYNEKIERILQKIPFSFSISMDGVTKETVEKVRVNARHETVLANFRRFHAYAKEKGTVVSLTFCLMPLNYHEFGEYLLFADEWNCVAVVNTVLHPPQHSFYTMSSSELQPIVEALDRQESSILPKLGMNKHVWVAEIERLRHRLSHADSDYLSFLPGPLVDPGSRSSLPVLSAAEVEPESQARSILAEWSMDARIDALLCNEEDVVIGTRSESDDFLGIPREDCLHRPFELILPLLRMKYGATTSLHRERNGAFVDRIIGFTATDNTRRTLRMLTLPRYESEGSFAGSITLAALVDRVHEEAGASP